MLNIENRLKGKSVAAAAADGEVFHLRGGGGADPNALALTLAKRLGIESVNVVASNPPVGGIALILCGIPDGEMHRARCEFYRYY